MSHTGDYRSHSTLTPNSPWATQVTITNHSLTHRLPLTQIAMSHTGDYHNPCTDMQSADWPLCTDYLLARYASFLFFLLSYFTKKTDEYICEIQKCPKQKWNKLKNEINKSKYPEIVTKQGGWDGRLPL